MNERLPFDIKDDVKRTACHFMSNSLKKISDVLRLLTLNTIETGGFALPAEELQSKSLNSVSN